MRKLASIRKIDAIAPIEGADAIEVAMIGGWKVVVKKNEFSAGDLAVYFEIDSWIPTELAPFLSKGKEPREFEGIRGERLRTVKLRGQLSQGLLLPIDPTCAIIADELFEGLDVSVPLNIKKWERVLPPQLAGQAKGIFPTAIPKTDQERCQNLAVEIEEAIQSGITFEITEKLEGASMTCYFIDGEFGVCSRNLDLRETDGNAFWAIARKENIEEKMRAVTGLGDFAIQGELIGAGIQGNIYALKGVEFRVFDVYSIRGGFYLSPSDRRALIDEMNLKHVPVLAEQADLRGSLEIQNIDDLLQFAEGNSLVGATGCEREGVVFKSTNGGMTYKAISNKYLLGEKNESSAVNLAKTLTF